MEQMVVTAIHQGNFHGGLAQCLGDSQAGESAADDDHSMLLHSTSFRQLERKMEVRLPRLHEGLVMSNKVRLTSLSSCAG